MEEPYYVLKYLKEVVAKQKILDKFSEEERVLLKQMAEEFEKKIEQYKFWKAVQTR